MTGLRIRTISGRAMALAIVMGALTGGTAVAAPDRSAPTAPTNLRVTGTTPYSVSLAWSASKDKSGIASYTICCAHNTMATVSGSTTSFTYTDGIEANRPFSFVVWAKDSAGNVSKASNTVTVTTPPDVTPPGKPSVTVTDIGPTHVSLAFASVEEGPVWFSVEMDGTTVITSSRESTALIGPLQPESTHTFRVRARDFAGQQSPVSDPVTVTTDPRDTSDTTGPTPITGLYVFLEAADGETWLIWTESTDDTTPQDLIVYKVFMNGAFNQSIMGFNRMIEYGVPNSHNVWTIIAVDANGNESAPVSITTNNT
jgi:chitodextrinase